MVIWSWPPGSSNIARPGARGPRSSIADATPRANGRSETCPTAQSTFGFLLLLLHEGENIEALDFAVREKAVDRIQRIHENLEDGVQLGERQQLDVALIGIHQFERAALLFQRCVTNHHAAETGGIDVIDVGQIEDYVKMAGGDRLVHFFAKGGG